MASTGSPVTLDWRADILRAIHDVFSRDLEAIHADLRTYTLLHSGNGSNILDALERNISAQVNICFTLVLYTISVVLSGISQRI